MPDVVTTVELDHAAGWENDRHADDERARHGDFAPNVPLLRKTLEHITAHPEEWEQSTWATHQPECGTSFCFAGHAVMFEGHDIAWEKSDCDCLECDMGGVSAEWCFVDGKPRSISNVAKHALGLSGEQANRLFGGGNSLEHIRELVDSFTNRADLEARSGS